MARMHLALRMSHRDKSPLNFEYANMQSKSSTPETFHLEISPLNLAA